MNMPLNRPFLTNHSIFKSNEYLKNSVFFEDKLFNQFEKANSQKEQKNHFILKRKIFWLLNFGGVVNMQNVLLLFGLNFMNRNPKICFFNNLMAYLSSCVCAFYLFTLIYLAFQETTNASIYLPVLICFVQISISTFFIKNKTHILKLNCDFKTLLRGMVNLFSN